MSYAKIMENLELINDEIRIEISIFNNIKLKIKEIDNILYEKNVKKFRLTNEEIKNTKNEKKLIKELLGNGDLDTAKKSTESLWANFEEKRILVNAPDDWYELSSIEENADVFDYYGSNKWDINGIKDDLKILKLRIKEKEEIGIEYEETPALWMMLKKINDNFQEKDYRNGDFWDIDGIKSDIEIVNSREPTIWKNNERSEEHEPTKQRIKKPVRKKKIKRVHKNKLPQNEVIDDSKLEKLSEFKKMYDEGLIDADEFKSLKDLILGR